MKKIVITILLLNLCVSTLQLVVDAAEAQNKNPESPPQAVNITVDSRIELLAAVQLLSGYDKRFGLIVIGGQTRILREYTDAESRIKTFDLMQVKSFREYMLKYKFEGEPLADAWLESKNRREFKKIVFQPEKHGVDANSRYPDCYNIWRGLAVNPKKANWDLIENHIGMVICNGKIKAYEWLLDWFAYTLQNLGDDKPKTAIVFQSGQGTGEVVFSGG